MEAIMVMNQDMQKKKTKKKNRANHNGIKNQ